MMQLFIVVPSFMRTARLMHHSRLISAAITPSTALRTTTSIAVLLYDTSAIAAIRKMPAKTVSAV